MTPFGGSHPDPLPDLNVNCTVLWVWSIFHECVVNNVQYAGFFLGLASILCWLVVFLPQFYAAYKTGQMDQAISLLFLICWFLGDVSNLVGSLLSNQLGTQIAVAYYFIAMDCLMLLQYAYYRIKNRRRLSQVRHSDSVAKPRENHVIFCVGVLLFLGSSSGWLATSQRQQPLSPWQPEWRGRSLLGGEDGDANSVICLAPFHDTDDCLFYNDGEIVGYVCGCISAVFYLASRLPQLYKNYQRKSVEGLAINMFILTVLGNVLYGLSIVLEYTSVVFLLRHLPWLVGSFGTLCFDCVMLVQFRSYGRRSTPASLDIQDERSRLLTPDY